MTEETTVPNTEEQVGGAEPVAVGETVSGNAESPSEPEAEATSEEQSPQEASVDVSTVAGGEAI